MDDFYREHGRSESRFHASPSACFPVPFLSSSPSPGRVPGDTIFRYDPKLLHHGQTVLDIPWNRSLSEVMERETSIDKKLSSHNECESLKCWRTKGFCGVICNPFLTSRLVLTGLLAVLLIIMTVLAWVFTSNNVQHAVKSVATEFRQELLFHTEDSVNAAFEGNNASAVSLATYLSSLNQLDNTSSFQVLEDQVRPVLFLVFSILGKKAEVTFFAQNGLFVSYLADSSGISILYSNSSYVSPIANGTEFWINGENLTMTRPWYKWYRQRVDENTGLPVGEPITLTPFPFWDFDPVKSSLHGQSVYSNWGPSINDPSSSLFAFISSVQKSPKYPIGVISIGLPSSNINKIFDQFDLKGGAVYLTMANGRLVAQTGETSGSRTLKDRSATTPLPPFATQSDNTLVAAAAEYLQPHISNILSLGSKPYISTSVELLGSQYMVESAPLSVSGTTLVCVVIIPYQSIWSLIEKWSHTTLAVLIALTSCTGLVGCFFVILLTKGVTNEMHLRASLIQQLEKTKNAETRSSHKSLVFANMSHDLRTPLAAILGLIDLCLCDASECSELGTNLIQMKSCATNLLGILNSILDMSKIEAGKLLLQESEFDLVGALEEVVDTFSVVGLKKGVEVALDLSDGSVENVSCVVGDVGRVKQIMANLLSNGVKFTSEGHVVLRAWVKPLCLSTSRPRFTFKGRSLHWLWTQYLRSPSRDKGLSDHGVSDDNYVNIEFEVDDSGKGIPKERWKSVFENFVQIESSGPRNYDGTGLGLGIVRSLVRLMGGDISIIDKDEPGEPGTRFRFNLVFKCGNKLKSEYASQDKRGRAMASQDALLQTTFGVNNQSVPSDWQLNPIFSHNSTDSVFGSSSVMENINVLLVMQGQGGKKIVKNWMERRGLQVLMVDHLEDLVPTIERIKQESLSESFSTSDRFDVVSPESHIYESWPDELDLKRTRTSTDAFLHMVPTSDGTSTVYSESAPRFKFHESQAHLLLVVDVTMVKVDLETVCSDLEHTLLESEHPALYRVVWLVNVDTPSGDVQYLRSQRSICHLVLQKPLYASRLQSIWGLLQDLVSNKVQDESQGELSSLSSGQPGDKIGFSATNPLFTSLSCMSTFMEGTKAQSKMKLHGNRMKAQSSSQAISRNLMSSELPQRFDQGSVGTSNPKLTNLEVQIAASQPSLVVHSEVVSNNNASDIRPHPIDNCRETLPMPLDPKQILSTMHILVAEDNPVLQRLTKTHLIRLGATVQCVENGDEAVRVVFDSLHKIKGCSVEKQSTMPFDLVLMDCEMPVLNGYEATQRIRSEESRYGIRTPVIALTAHAMAQDEKKCIEAGMDFYLTKPLKMDALLDVVSKIMS